MQSVSRQSGPQRYLAAAVYACLGCSLAMAQTPPDSTPSMLKMIAGSGFSARVLLTVGDTIGDYTPPGVLDGTGAWIWDDETVRIVVNHELANSVGYLYELANGTELRGARISYFDIDRATRQITDAGLAFDTILDRRGQTVVATEQVNEFWGKNSPRGLDTFCSGAGYSAGDRGFVDDIYFTFEEVSAKRNHPHGGSAWALDVRNGDLWSLPELGRGSWENATAVATPDGHKADGHVAMLLGDDFEFGAVPLYLWVGRKQPDGTFIERNGLAAGQFYAWVTDNGDTSPEQWNGTGNVRSGHFIPLQVRDKGLAGEDGYDRDGYLDDLTLRASARDAGAFRFSRAEDLHTNPFDGGQVVLASTGHGKQFPSDDWGTVYLIEINFETDAEALVPSAKLTIVHDGDDYGDFGIRSPDNLVWATDGAAYIQEDKATKLADFGEDSGREASIWRLEMTPPYAYTRIAEIDRNVLVPEGTVDRAPKILGEWESSGVLDVSGVFGAGPEELLLLVTVQAHSLRDGPLGGRRDLFQGGQLLLLSGPRQNER